MVKGISKILVFLLVCLLVAFVFLNRDKQWAGFTNYTHTTQEGEVFQRGPTLWEWMKLLIVPAVLAFGGFWLNSQARQSESKIASDRNQEAALQTYLDRMTELLLKEKLRDSKPEDEVRTVARTRTLTVLRGLEEKRKSAVMWFLLESKLVSADPQQKDGSGPIVSLSGADIGGADLTRANLSGADLHGADLSGANLDTANLSKALLSGADLSKAFLNHTDLREADLIAANLSAAILVEADLLGADLSGANLSGANLFAARLTEADLFGADLSGADLSDARVTSEQLRSARALDKAVMPIGTIYKPGSLGPKPPSPETTAPATTSGQEPPESHTPTETGKSE
jgi:hypothetical protein